MRKSGLSVASPASYLENVTPTDNGQSVTHLIREAYPALARQPMNAVLRTVALDDLVFAALALERKLEL